MLVKRYRVERRDHDDGSIDYVVIGPDGSAVCDVPEAYFDGDVSRQRRAAQRIAEALGDAGV